jgi:topoisomerase-4 subunit A
LRACVASEIEGDAKKYGDDRRTFIEAAEKVTMSDAKTVSIVDEPTTLIVSKHGWLRSRQGHNIDPTQLTFRSGDSLLACLPCRTVDQLVLLDSNGRAYSIAAADIPGGKGDGIPATSLADFQDGGKPCLALADQERRNIWSQPTAATVSAVRAAICCRAAKPAKPS